MILSFSFKQKISHCFDFHLITEIDPMMSQKIHHVVVEIFEKIGELRNHLCQFQF